MVTWAEVGLHISVTRRSSQGHNNVKSAKKGENSKYLLQLCMFRMSMMAETHLCPKHGGTPNTSQSIYSINLKICPFLSLSPIPPPPPPEEGKYGF